MAANQPILWHENDQNESFNILWNQLDRSVVVRFHLQHLEPWLCTTDIEDERNCLVCILYTQSHWHTQLFSFFFLLSIYLFRKSVWNQWECVRQRRDQRKRDEWTNEAHFQNAFIGRRCLANAQTIALYAGGMGIHLHMDAMNLIITNGFTSQNGEKTFDNQLQTC